jgi:hypothetical protein
MEGPALLTPDQEAALLNFAPMATAQGKPVKGEPIGVFDLSPSMLQSAGPNTNLTKFELLSEGVPIIVDKLGSLDQAGEHEEGGGGLMSYAYADTVKQLGDLNKANVAQVWATLQPFGRGTYTGAALELALENALDEEDLDPTTPIVIWLGTDGEAHDPDKVEKFFRQSVRGRVRLAVTVFGESGQDTDHDAVVEQYLAIQAMDEAHKTHMRVTTASQMTSGQELATAALSLFGVPL